MIRTVDALCVGDCACGAQSIVVLLVAHQRVHSKDSCKYREAITNKIILRVMDCAFVVLGVTAWAVDVLLH